MVRFAFADSEHIAGKPADVIITGEKILEIGRSTLSLLRPLAIRLEAFRIM